MILRVMKEKKEVCNVKQFDLIDPFMMCVVAIIPSTKIRIEAKTLDIIKKIKDEFQKFQT